MVLALGLQLSSINLAFLEYATNVADCTMQADLQWRWTYRPPSGSAVLWRSACAISDLPGLDWLVPDAAEHRLVYFSASGLPQWDYQVRLGFDFSPAGVCQVTNHALWVTDWRLGRIECRSVFGHSLGRAPPLPDGACRSPADICSTREGHLLLTDLSSSRLYRLDAEGRHLATIELGKGDRPLRPSYVDCCHDNGFIAVSDIENGRAAVLNPRGDLLAFLWAASTEDEPQQPFGLRFDASGRHVLLCDSGAHRVARHSLEGAFVDAPISGGQIKPESAETAAWRPRGLACSGSPANGICVVAAGSQGRDSLHCFGRLP
ncbi:hypothetical protein BOX15_Mlig034509g1 [Macrostomum lignano]|uniref:SMP-30/Gluconolactonase/LRE-like region domain-containing protein n=1 Tax=Macrostomum lignano TaxID=282301 RepID=A0A267FAJ8_9PLAT|nr:hypothetical protein BOX15_Mlig034509g1 [Macrostomum lignano]